MRVIEFPADNIWEKRLKSGLVLSLLLHVLFVYFVVKTNPPKHPVESFLDVSIIPDTPKNTEPKIDKINQMVEPPQNEESPVDKDIDTNLLSDKNFSTEKEQIKHGDRPDAAPVVSKMSKPVQEKQPQQKKEESAQPKDVPNQKITTLRLDSGTLYEKFSNPKTAKPSQSSPTSSYQAFSRPEGSGAAFIGLSGTSDFLPNLPDGDITLLNAKADKFAVFVRRVASLVFSHMRSTGWERLSASDIGRIEDFSTVHAVLNSNGTLMKITLESASGSKIFDETLSLAVKSGAHDPNPPEAAKADDGNFHFIFKSKSWSRVGIAPKTGAAFERRWLLLATGLL
jgi:hypothetical protein